uniref:Uncharacterized protein n=1 Tax=Aegilops tauschii subsp. strangulata TaxID=200361 RepID=A0A453JIG6_AEGTS
MPFFTSSSSILHSYLIGFAKRARSYSYTKYGTRSSRSSIYKYSMNINALQVCNHPPTTPALYLYLYLSCQ